MKTIVLILFVLLAGCATGPTPYEVEYDTYSQFLKQEYEKGNLTLAEVLTLAQAKASELNARQSAVQAQGLAEAGLGLSILQQNRPVYAPPVRCTSVQQGVFTNTQCF